LGNLEFYQKEEFLRDQKITSHLEKANLFNLRKKNTNPIYYSEKLKNYFKFDKNSSLNKNFRKKKKKKKNDISGYSYNRINDYSNSPDTFNSKTENQIKDENSPLSKYRKNFRKQSGETYNSSFIINSDKSSHISNKSGYSNNFEEIENFQIDYKDPKADIENTFTSNKSKKLKLKNILSSISKNQTYNKYFNNLQNNKNYSGNVYDLIKSNQNLIEEKKKDSFYKFNYENNKNDKFQTVINSDRIKKESNQNALFSYKTSNLFKNLLSKKLLNFNIYRENHRLSYDKCRILRKNIRVFDSLSEDEEAITNKKFIIKLDSNFRNCLDFGIVLVTLYSFIISPLKINKLFNVNCYSIIFELIFDVILLIDLLSGYFKAYYDNEENYIDNFSKTFKNYLNSNFFLDFICSIPFNSILEINQFNNNHISLMQSPNEKNIIWNFSLLFFYKNKCLDLLRIIRAIKLIKILKSENQFLQKVSELFTSDDQFYSILKYLLIMYLLFILVSNILTCLFIFFASLDETNWVISSSLQDKSFSFLYLSSLYFVHTTIFSVGYGDILSKNIYERIFNIFLMILGVFLFSFALTALSNEIKSNEEKEKYYRENKQYLNDLQKNHEINNSLYKKISRHLFFIHKSNDKNKNILLNDIPNNLKRDVILNMNKELITKCRFFKDLFNKEFLAEILNSLKPTILQKNESLIKQGDFVEEVIFIRKGILQLETIVNIEIDYNKINYSKVDRIKNNCYSLNSKCFENLEKKKKVIKEKELNDYNSKLIKKVRTNSTFYNKQSTLNLFDKKFSGKTLDLNKTVDNSNIIYKIKIAKLKKNEYFGDSLIIEGKRSDFTLKTNSRNSELFLMDKFNLFNLLKENHFLFEKLYNQMIPNNKKLVDFLIIAKNVAKNKAYEKVLEINCRPMNNNYFILNRNEIFNYLTYNKIFDNLKDNIFCFSEEECQVGVDYLVKQDRKSLENNNQKNFTKFNYLDNNNKFIKAEKQYGFKDLIPNSILPVKQLFNTNKYDNSGIFNKNAYSESIKNFSNILESDSLIFNKSLSLNTDNEKDQIIDSKNILLNKSTNKTIKNSNIYPHNMEEIYLNLTENMNSKKLSNKDIVNISSNDSSNFLEHTKVENEFIENEVSINLMNYKDKIPSLCENYYEGKSFNNRNFMKNDILNDNSEMKKQESLMIFNDNKLNMNNCHFICEYCKAENISLNIIDKNKFLVYEKTIEHTSSLSIIGNSTKDFSSFEISNLKTIKTKNKKYNIHKNLTSLKSSMYKSSYFDEGFSERENFQHKENISDSCFIYRNKKKELDHYKNSADIENKKKITYTKEISAEKKSMNDTFYFERKNSKKKFIESMQNVTNKSKSRDSSLNDNKLRLNVKNICYLSNKSNKNLNVKMLNLQSESNSIIEKNSNKLKKIKTFKSSLNKPNKKNPFKSLLHEKFENKKSAKFESELTHEYKSLNEINKIKSNFFGLNDESIKELFKDYIKKKKITSKDENIRAALNRLDKIYGTFKNFLVK